MLASFYERGSGIGGKLSPCQILILLLFIFISFQNMDLIATENAKSFQDILTGVAAI
ncbi:hypothetical protein AGR13a_Lc80038 [Agrobacterium genomosp. 13 str. CFBP 6927]|uniref:Uncharacterized protein n=1 Tax=Agrobacterium genomosp. 13 str. CFBP 6927 TaxID=1183428 RepID=A0ABP2BP27_9HYPH|nr:hypothetical protein AGR13a_Lc80038 [Agrobacterium genomosp. 13 str. CFBP 6927]